MTRPTALSDETLEVTSFLAISRRFLGLAASSPVRTTAVAGADTFPRAAAASLLATSRRQIAATRYRKVARSLLLATGLGAFIPGQAFASLEFWNISDREAGQERYSKILAQRHQQLREALGLTAEQESGWEKLVASEASKQDLGVGQPKDWSSLSVPERAEKMLELSRKHQARMTEHVAALKDFYAMLNPDQQKSFEAFHAGPPGLQNPAAAGPSPSS